MLLIRQPARMLRTAVTLLWPIMYYCWLYQDTICFYIVSSFPLITDHTVPKKDYIERCCFSSQLLCLCFSCTTFNCYDGSCIYYTNLSKIKSIAKITLVSILCSGSDFFFKCSIWTSEKRKRFPVSAVAGVFAAKKCILKVSLSSFLTY